MIYLVPVDNTMYILQENLLKRFISTKKSTLNKKHFKVTLKDMTCGTQMLRIKSYSAVKQR